MRYWLGLWCCFCKGSWQRVFRFKAPLSTASQGRLLKYSLRALIPSGISASLLVWGNLQVWCVFFEWWQEGRFLNAAKYFAGGSIDGWQRVQKAQQVTRNVPKIYQMQDIRGFYLSSTVPIDCTSTFLI